MNEIPKDAYELNIYTLGIQEENIFFLIKHYGSLMSDELVEALLGQAQGCGYHAVNQSRADWEALQND